MNAVRPPAASVETPTQRERKAGQREEQTRAESQSAGTGFQSGRGMPEVGGRAGPTQ